MANLSDDKTMTLRDFFSWWVRQLAACLPTVLRGLGAKAFAGAVVALASPPGVVPATVEVTLPGRRNLPPRRLTVNLTDSGLDQLRDALGRRRQPCVRLLLPHGVLLERDVVLPIAAEGALDRVLHYELDRLTPFRSDQILWGFEVTRRDRDRGQLHLRLTLGLLATLSPLLDSLRRIRAVPTLLESEPAPNATDRRGCRIALGVTGPSHYRGPLRAAWAICIALAATAVVLPFVRQSLTLGAIQTRIDALQPSVTEAESLRRRASAAAADGDIMKAERLRVGDPLQALAETTDALPDDTWLTDLTLRQRKLTLAGQSQDPARLIGRLSTQTALRNPSFSAPITRSQTGRGDLFSIDAELLP
jgi:general secretion pathway protein L